MELYAAVRLAVVDEGLSHHEAGRRFGIDRRTVKKMLSYSAPPGYRRTKPVRRPKLDGFTGIVDAILEADTGRRRRPSSTAMSAPSPSSAGFRARSSMTTPPWRWRGSWGTACAGAPARSHIFSRTTCSATASAGPARAKTRARSRPW